MLHGTFGADVEHEHLDGTDLRLDLLDECDNFFFLAGMGTKAVGLAFLVADLFEQRRKLLGIAAGGADNEPFTSKPACDGSAGRITCADDQRDFQASGFHELPFL